MRAADRIIFFLNSWFVVYLVGVMVIGVYCYLFFGQPIAVSDDPAISLLSTQQFLRGETPFPNLLRLPDLTNLNLFVRRWIIWWPPALSFLATPFLAMFSIGTATKALSLFFLVSGSLGWAAVTRKLGLQRRVGVLVVVFFPVFICTRNSVFIRFVTDFLLAGVIPWGVLLTLHGLNCKKPLFFFLAGATFGGLYTLKYSATFMVLGGVLFGAILLFKERDGNSFRNVRLLGALLLGTALPVACVSILNFKYQGQVTPLFLFTQSYLPNSLSWKALIASASTNPARAFLGQQLWDSTDIQLGWILRTGLLTFAGGYLYLRYQRYSQAGTRLGVLLLTLGFVPVLGVFYFSQRVGANYFGLAYFDRLNAAAFFVFLLWLFSLLQTIGSMTVRWRVLILCLILFVGFHHLSLGVRMTRLTLANMARISKSANGLMHESLGSSGSKVVAKVSEISRPGDILWWELCEGTAAIALDFPRDSIIMQPSAYSERDPIVPIQTRSQKNIFLIWERCRPQSGAMLKMGPLGGTGWRKLSLNADLPVDVWLLPGSLR